MPRYFSKLGIPAKKMLSATTRPQRANESPGAYFFMSKEGFKRKERQGHFLEVTNFRKWYYGLFKSEIQPGRINIGVFDLNGLEHLYQHKLQYNIIPIYIKEESMERLKRSRKREGHWRLEHFRRMIADDMAFRKAEDTIKKFKNYIILDRPSGVWESTLVIMDGLRRFNVIAVDGEDFLTLGISE